MVARVAAPKLRDAIGVNTARAAALAMGFAYLCLCNGCRVYTVTVPSDTVRSPLSIILPLTVTLADMPLTVRSPYT